MRTIKDSFLRQKPLVRAIIAFTVLAGAVMFIMGVSDDEVRLRETGVMLSIVLPVIGLLEDRIYRKSRERYLETKAAAERQKLGLPPLSAPVTAASAPSTMTLPPRSALPAARQPSPWSRPLTATPESKPDTNAIDWYGLYG
jgi:hypothetical protein